MTNKTSNASKDTLAAASADMDMSDDGELAGFDVIQAILKVYFGTIFVDLENDTYTTLKEVKSLTQRGFPTQGKAQKTLFKLASPKVCLPEHAAAMHEFMDLSTLDERLRDADTVTLEYQGTTMGWQRILFTACDRREDGSVKTAIMAVRAINDEKEKEFAQLKAVEKERERVAEAYGMIHGLSQEYHTIWVVSKETSRMRLVRSSGKSTIQGAVQMGIDMPEFDSGFDAYIDTYVEPEDRERMHRQIAFTEVLRQLEEHPDETYKVNYLRRTDDGTVGHHQIAFANADTEDGRRFVYGFRDVDALVREEQARRLDLEERQAQLEEATAEQEAQLEEITALNTELETARNAADAANVAKTSFLFNMSHDIRTPMNAIVGFTELLRKHQDDPVRRQDYLAKIEGASRSLLSIINNVLDMARIESGAAELDEVPWSVDAVNDTIRDMFGGLMAEKGLEFTLETQVKHHFVYADPTKLNQVINNLLSNACKYTEPGGRVAMVTKEVESDRPGFALFRTTVSDTGIGMDADYLPHLFEEFSRESTTTESKIEGTGLGMPIVKRLVDLMGGTIQVESEKGVGTTFTVTLSHRIADEALEGAPAAEVDPAAFVGKRILLAEDNDLNAEIAMELLGEFGFQVDRAEDGDVCLDMLKQAPAGSYDVILMDVQMPHMNGYDATRAIRQLPDPGKSSIPILAMTANAFEQDKREALRIGMNGHIAKPIDIPTLMRSLAGVL